MDGFFLGGVMGTRALAGLVLVAALGAGCTGDPEPKIADPTPSASSSAASPSPTVSEAANPEQAYRDFIDGYVAAISESLSTGDPSAWLDLSDPACENCQNLADGVAAAYEGGGRIDGAEWVLRSATFARDGQLGQVWAVDVIRSRETWLDASGQRVKTVKAGELRFEFAIDAGAAGALSVRELRPLE